MNHRAPAAGLFPTDPGEIEHVAELLAVEASGAGLAAPSQLLRAALADELRRDWRGPLPRAFADVAFYAPGYFQDAARLYVQLGLIGDRLPWADSEALRSDLANALRGLAVQRLQYIAGEHVETVAVVLPVLRDAAKRKRATDRRRVENAGAARRGETWVRVALAAVLLAEADACIPSAGRWQKLAQRALAERGLDVELSFLKNNGTELRLALAAVKSAAT
jgi:hypothetical protein